MSLILGFCDSMWLMWVVYEEVSAGIALQWNSEVSLEEIFGHYVQLCKIF